MSNSPEASTDPDDAVKATEEVAPAVTTAPHAEPTVSRLVDTPEEEPDDVKHVAASDPEPELGSPPPQPDMVAEAHPRGWVQLENRFYRRTTLYDDPSADLSSCDLARALVACAPCGGPLAVVSDSGWGLTPLTVYAANGTMLARYPSLRKLSGAPVRVVALGWIRGDRLVVVFEDGYIVRIALPGAAVECRRVSDPELATVLDPESGRPKSIADAVVLPQGQVVVRTSSGVIFTSSSDEVPVALSSTGIPPPSRVLEQPGSSAAMVATALDNSSRALDIDVLVIGQGGNLTRVNSSSVVPVADEQVHDRLSVSPDGKYVASTLEDGHIVVRNIRSLAQVVYVVIPAHFLPLSSDMSPSRPALVAWVGPDAVAVTFGGTLLLIGPGGGVAPCALPSDASPYLVLYTESDGLRVVTKTTCEFVQMVPESIEAAFYREESPARKLLRASFPDDDGQAHKVPKGLDTLSSLLGEASPGERALERYRLLTELREKDELHQASRGCVDASLLSWDPDEQKLLLKSAVYGQKFGLVLGGIMPDASAAGNGPRSVLPVTRVSARRSSEANDHGVPLAIATIRVLTAVRSADIGLPLTKPQLGVLGYANLVRRLSEYGRHHLALRIAAFCGVSPNDALSGWARDCFLSSESDDVIAAQVVAYFERTRVMFQRSSGLAKLSSPPPYVAAAEDAFAYGRQRCAELLLRRESSPARKVPLYLEMRLESLAMLAAIASSDNEVILHVIQDLRETRSIRELASLLKKLPSSMSHRATDLLVVHMRESGEIDGVRDLLQDVGRHREAAMEVISDADAVEDPKARLVALEKASASLSRWGSRRSNAFEVQCLQQAISTVLNAFDLEKRLGVTTTSLTKATSTQLLAFAATIPDPTRRRDSLLRLRRDLKIPERRFFWVVLEALAQAGEMSAVEALSNSGPHGRPPPIGLMAFVDVCLRHGKEAEAMKYALRIADLRDRARALARCGRGKEAAEIASKLRNQQLMEEVEVLVARHSASISISGSSTA